MQKRMSIEEWIVADAPAIYRLLKWGLAITILLGFFIPGLILFGFGREFKWFECLIYVLGFLICTLIFGIGLNFIERERYKRWVHKNLSNAYYLPLEKSEATIEACRIETEEDDYGKVWTYHWITVKFLPESQPQFLQARVTKAFYETVAEGMILSVKFNKTNPRVAIFEGETRYDQFG